MALQDADKRQARELLMKSKIYGVLGTVFAIFGIIIFLAIYTQYYQGDITKAIRDPFIVIFIIFPFVPAIMLSLKGKRAEKALSKLLNTSE